MTRSRTLPRLMAVFAFFLSSLMAPAFAEGGTSARMKDVMPYLETYNKIPPSERSLIQIVYRIKSKSLPEDQVRAWYELDGQRVDLPLNHRGELWDAPDMKTYEKNPLVYTNISRSDIVLATRVRPDIALDTSMDGAQLRNALKQADKGIKRVSGWFAFLRPSVKGYYIELKAGSTAELHYANGKTEALTVNPLNPLYSNIILERDQLNGVEKVTLSNAPILMRFQD